LVVAIIGYAFWNASPWRDQWLWLLVLLIPLLAARWTRYERLWTRSPLDGWLLALLALAILNIIVAPYTRGIIMLSRPLLGLAIYICMVEYARIHGKLNPLLSASIVLAGLIGILSLTASQWNSKSEPLRFIIDRLPIVQNFPGAEQGFNANEIAGAVAWFAPLMACIAYARWRSHEPYWAAAAAFICLVSGLFLGQSRLALLGVAMAFGLAALLLIQSQRWRYFALAGLAALAAGEILLFSNVSVTPQQQNLPPTRDEQSLIGRQDIWDSALHIVRDYPLTGVGMSMFRDSRVREAYPAPGYLMAVLPHAHNEWLQVAADLGLPGLAIFAGLNVTVVYMLVYCWKNGADRILLVGVGGGLLAHAVYGLADAITLWDRFIFIYWWLLGLVGAQYILLKHPH
jgi:putative inorganic carbon (hco3(-)) transporter